MGDPDAALLDHQHIGKPGQYRFAADLCPFGFFGDNPDGITHPALIRRFSVFQADHIGHVIDNEL